MTPNFATTKHQAIKILLMFLSALVLFGLSDLSNATTRKLVLKDDVNPSDQKRFALVIGNSEYESPEVPHLSNPTNDAQDMADTLNKLNFNVIEVLNATQKEMNRAIAAFGENLEPNTVALFYYAGHGLQVNGKNYLVPVDADISHSSAISAETVDMDTVLDQLSSSKVSIVILDACRNNPFKKARSIGGGLAQLQAPKGSYIAYATAPGRTASDGGGRNGLYTQELLKNINKPGLSLEEVFKSVRVNVAKATSDDQIPWDSSSLTGNFYFNGQPSSDLEGVLWSKIKDSSSTADYKTYLVQYPNGQHVKQAEDAIAKLERNAKIEQARREEEDRNWHARQEEEQRKLDNDRQRMETEKEQMQRDTETRHSTPAPYVPPSF
jgi:hypothetical protein